MRTLLIALSLALLPAVASAQSVILSQYPPGRAAAAISLSMTLSTEDKAVLDSLAGYLDGVEGYLDGVEGLLGTIDADTGSILLAVDGLEGYLDGVEGYLDGLEGFVDGIEGSVSTTATNTGNSATHLDVLDDWDETNRAAVNLIAGQVGVSGGEGNNAATVLRMTLALDDPAALDLEAIRTATEGAATSLETIQSALSADAVHGNTAIATGPQQLIEYNSATVAVSTGQSARQQGSSKGEAYMVIRDAAGNGRGANVSASNALLVSQLDPCSSEAKTTTPISLTADTVIIPAVASKKNYICSLVVVAGAAEIVSITEGTGSTCGTSEAALFGSTTDANGASFAANGGVAANGGGATTIAGITANVDTCLNVSGSNRVSGYVTWVQR